MAEKKNNFQWSVPWDKWFSVIIPYLLKETNSIESIYFEQFNKLLCKHVPAHIEPMEFMNEVFIVLMEKLKSSSGEQIKNAAENGKAAYCMRVIQNAIADTKRKLMTPIQQEFTDKALALQKYLERAGDKSTISLVSQNGKSRRSRTWVHCDGDKTKPTATQEQIDKLFSSITMVEWNNNAVAIELMRRLAIPVKEEMLIDSIINAVSAVYEDNIETDIDDPKSGASVSLYVDYESEVEKLIESLDENERKYLHAQFNSEEMISSDKSFAEKFGFSASNMSKFKHNIFDKIKRFFEEIQLWDEDERRAFLNAVNVCLSRRR